jgi:hypothetical protein
MSTLPSGYRDAVIALLVLVACLFVFRRAPIQQLNDSRYSMLLAENLLTYGDFALERYHLPESDYRLQHVDGHDYYGFPAGSAVLSVPFVAIMRLRNLSAIDRDGHYDEVGELILDFRLATLLMALFAMCAYLTARLLLPTGHSIAIATLSAFGTQVFSSFSRSTYSDSWGVLLVLLMTFLMLRARVRHSRLSLFVLGTIASWAYIVRPTNAIVIAGVLLYVSLRDLRRLCQFLAPLGAWIGLFIAYSWIHYHRVLPTYFAADRLQFSAPVRALFGNLVSPSRGLIVYVPAWLAVATILAVFRRTVRCPDLTLMSGLVIAGHLAMLAGFTHWWGGWSYGARLTGGLVPWFVLLAILGLDAAFRASANTTSASRRRLWVSSMLPLCAASIAINGVGACSEEANRWNGVPDNVDFNPARLWSWRRPQFLAPFVEPPGPFLTLPAEGLRVGEPDAEKYLGLGWASGEGDFRWTNGRGASSLRFSAQGSGTIEIDLRPYLGERADSVERLAVTVNGIVLATMTLTTLAFATYDVDVPANVVRPENTLRLVHPDAIDPPQIGRLPDHRVLGVAVRTIRWRQETSSLTTIPSENGLGGPVTSR